MEPLYEYVKGEGWKPVSRNLVTLACGTVVTVERKETTEIGERSFTYYRYRTFDEVLSLMAKKRLDHSNLSARYEDEDYFYYVVTIT